MSGAPFEQWWAPVRRRMARRRACSGWAPDRATLVAGRRAGVWRRPARSIARQRRITDVALVRAARQRHDRARLVQAVAEGVVLAQHDTGHLKSAPPELAHVRRVWLVVRGTSAAQRAQRSTPRSERGRVLAECTNLARALGNEPANVLTPRELARRAQAAAEGTTLSVTVLDEERDPRARHGVAARRLAGQRRAAARDRARAQPARRAGRRRCSALVGKGITFDTGGISIKPADGMERMKVDMAGGAAVIGALRAVALLDAPIRVIGIVPTTENMPGGRAIKPGDVIRGAVGQDRRGRSTPTRKAG